MAKIVFQAEPIEDFYDIGEELGRGNFAVVKRCKHKENGGEYAAKCITKKRSKASKRGMSKEAVEIEAGVLMALEHEAIIKLYDVFETRTNMTLVMELLTGGELFEEIAKQEFIMEKDACFYVKQILSAIQHMHSQNIVHLDLKPENIVLKYPGSKEIKLIDFGLAKILDPDKELREMLGTPEFSAPEVISYEPVGPFTDMWAIGVVTYVLLSGASPFLGDDDQETYHNITSCDYQFDDEYFEKITEHAKDFIRKLLIKKPRERNTIDDCLDHHWIAFEDEENSIIDTQKMRAFVARRRWKQSLKLVATISRLKMLYRNSTPSPPPDVSGDEDDNENDESAKGNSVNGQEGKLKSLVGSNLFSNIAGDGKDRAEKASENNALCIDRNSPKANDDLITDCKERKEANGEEGKENHHGAVEARSENVGHISSSCEENYVDDVVTPSSIEDSSSLTQKNTLEAGSEEQRSKIESSDDLSLMNRPAAGEILFDHISAVENVRLNSETEHLNESVPSETANLAQHNVELLSSEENPAKLRVSFDEDCDGHDATVESQRCSLNDDDINDVDEDLNVEGLQTVETGNVKDFQQHDFLDSSVSDTLKEQNGVLLKEERVSSGCPSDDGEIIHVESHSKEKADGDSTIIVKQNITKPVVFKLDMNVSQNPEKSGTESLEHAERAPKENSVGGKFVIRPTGDTLARCKKDACTVTLSSTSGEKHEKTKAVPNDIARNESINTDSRRTVVSKSFTKITVNSGKAKQDTHRLQNSSLIKVGIPLATDKALNAIGMTEELRGVPGMREVTVENDDDMVVIEMIEPINNNS